MHVMPASTINMADWFTVRPVPKRAFAFRYTESLGPKKFVCPTEKNRLFQAVGKSNFRGLLIILLLKHGILVC